MSSDLVLDLSSASSVVYEPRRQRINTVLAKMQSVLLTHSPYKHFTVNSGTSVSQDRMYKVEAIILAMTITNPWY